MLELIFSYNNARCHATIVESLVGNERFIGRMNGYEVYRLPGIMFDQFGFVAIKEEA